MPAFVDADGDGIPDQLQTDDAIDGQELAYRTKGCFLASLSSNGFRLLQFVTFGLAVGLLVTVELLHDEVSIKKDDSPHGLSGRTNIGLVVGGQSQWTCGKHANATGTGELSRYLLSEPDSTFVKRGVSVYSYVQDRTRVLASWTSPTYRCTLACDTVACAPKADSERLRSVTVTALNDANGVVAEDVSGECAVTSRCSVCTNPSHLLSTVTCEERPCILLVAAPGVQKFTGEHLFFMWKWPPEIWQATAWY